MNRLRFYGFETNSEATEITKETSEISVHQVHGYDPPRIFLYGAEVRFCSVVEFVSTRKRYITDVTGCPDWSSEPCWHMSADTLLAAEINLVSTKRFESFLCEENEIEIPANGRPSKLLLIGSAQRPLGNLRVRRIQSFPIAFTCSDGEAVEECFEFTVTEMFGPKTHRTTSGASLHRRSIDEHSPEVDHPEGGHEHD
jgi:hypothetical protein